MRILRPIFHLLVLAAVVFLIYQFVIFPVIMTARARVIHVLDADSLMIMEDGAVKKVQLIGVDAPEGRQECLAATARQAAADFFAKNREVSLEKDDAAGEMDIHGRLLRYVRLTDGRLLNEELLQEGLARQYHTEHAKKADFEVLEKAARAEGRGVWGACK